MPPKKELPQGVINPFSDSFLNTWDMWKQYKLEEFKFKYKGCLSEQAALIRLSELSRGLEPVAIAIVKQSMANSWKGFFELKNNSYGQGESIAEKRQNVADFLNRRDY